MAGSRPERRSWRDLRDADVVGTRSRWPVVDLGDGEAPMSSKKIIRISHCLECPHHGSRGSGPREEIYCCHDDIECGEGAVGPMSNFTPIPDWCPLEDAPDAD